MNRGALKTALRRVGLYSVVHSCYRALDPGARRSRRQLTGFYRRFVGRGDLVFDVGSNVGQSIEAMAWGCGARVVSVEPNPHCRELLAWRFGRDPAVTVVGRAVGAEPGRAEFHFEGTNGTGSLRGDWPFPASEACQVEITTLDRLIEEHGTPRLCKVDVEGFEVEVFRGLSRPIPVIVFEYHRNEFDRVRACFEQLARAGTVTSANATSLDSFEFLYPEFDAPQRLLDRLAAETQEHGNVVVCMSGPT